MSTRRFGSTAPPGEPPIGPDRGHRYTRSHPAPVAQGIEHWPPEPGAQVRILPGAPCLSGGLLARPTRPPGQSAFGGSRRPKQTPVRLGCRTRPPWRPGLGAAFAAGLPLGCGVISAHVATLEGAKRNRRQSGRAAARVCRGIAEHGWVYQADFWPALRVHPDNRRSVEVAGQNRRRSAWAAALVPRGDQAWALLLRPDSAPAGRPPR